MSQHIPESPILRLACMNCDREDYDGASLQQAVDDGWQDIGEVEVLHQSTWWTHLGYCPNCQDYVEQEQEASQG